MPGNDDGGRNGSGGGKGPESGDGPTGEPDPQLGGLLSRLAESMGPSGVELGGENVRFEQAPEDGLEVRITLLDDDGAITSVASMLTPAREPPAAQPEGVPFVRSAALRVIKDYVRGVLLAMWMLDEGADPEQALAAVLRASREAGWRLQNPEDAGAEGPYRLVRDDRVRRVEAKESHTGPVISLSQKRLGP